MNATEKLKEQYKYVVEKTNEGTTILIKSPASELIYPNSSSTIDLMFAISNPSIHNKDIRDIGIQLTENSLSKNKGFNRQKNLSCFITFEELELIYKEACKSYK